ncbi:MAG: carbohydrate ABC transporter permease [Firmicutes bacterium]|nr:carbohydrate ABC transporter permease [Lachnospiraceae bacterium]MBQ1391757.1 carbohydrate ABC transporter permease [Bacillota bacterium]
MHFQKTFGDRVFDFVVYFLVVLIIVITLYPLIYVFSMAISDPIAAARGDVWFLPVGINLTAVRKVLADPQVITYYGNTIWFTVVGTICGVITTSLCAYPLSRKEFLHRKLITKIVMVTMFFNGGIIPTYIVVGRFLHLYNSRWAIIVCALTTAWYVMISRSFFESLPDEIIESARIDGASEYRIFGQFVLPLSKPILAVLTLYMGVGHWNAYFNSMLYLSDRTKQPLALYIRSVVIQNTLSSALGNTEALTAAEILSALQLKYAVIIVSVLPMLVIYPFISKNLEKGLMIGAVKG